MSSFTCKKCGEKIPMENVKRQPGGIYRCTCPTCGTVKEVRK